MNLHDRRTGQPYRRLAAPVTQAEVDAYADSIEREVAEERERMRQKRLTAEEIVERAETKRRDDRVARELIYSSLYRRLWMYVGAGLLYVVGWLVFHEILKAMQ
jgi:uncharacterized membrane protein YdbT with pleckstrin-like domain